MQRQTDNVLPHPSLDGSTLRVAVVGGGMCGLTLAIVLHRSGINVEVFESANGLGEIGASVTYGWNALRALQLMDLYDVLVDRIGQGPQVKPMNFTLDHQEGEMDAWTQGTEALPADLSFHRAAFLDALSPLFPPDRLHYSKRCKDISLESASRLYRLHFQDGTSHQAHLIIGADGIRSTIRRVLAQGPAQCGQENEQELTQGSRLKDDKNIMFTGMKLYRALVPADALKEAGLKRDIRNMKMCVGTGGNIFTVPIKNGSLINVAAFTVVSPGPAGSYHPPLPSPWTVKSVPNAEVVKAFSDWSDDAKIILRSMGDPSCWALHSIGPVLDTFVQGRIALVGDAAHPSTPFLGAGVGQGIEDVFLLWKLLTDPRTSLTNLEGVLQVYDIFRRPRANWVVTASGEAPRVWPVLADRNVEESRKVETMKQWERDWCETRNHDVEVDAVAAVRWLEEKGHFGQQESLLKSGASAEPVHPTGPVHAGG